MTENLDQDIGARIKKARKKNGMTQEDLGHLVGVSYQQIQKYESGQNRVSASRLTEIARVLNCKPKNFFGDDENSLASGFSESPATSLISPEALSFAIELDFIKDADVRQKMVELVRSLSKHAI